MPTTYAPATPEEVTTVMAAFYSKARIPTGFAVNLSWDPPVRRIVGGTPDPDELAAIKAARIVRGAELDALVPGPGNIVVAMGDSITDTFDPSAKPESYFRWATRLAGQVVRDGGVYATPSMTAEQIRDTHLPEVLARDPHPRYCVVLAGANNTNVATTKTTLTQIYDALRAAQITPILGLLTPKADLAFVGALNQWMRSYALANNLPFVDFSAATADQATGLWKAGMSGDGIHPTAAGAEAMGTALAAVLTRLAAGLDNPLPVTQGDPTNLFVAPLFLAGFTDANGDLLPDTVGARKGLAFIGGQADTTITYGEEPGVVVGRWLNIARTGSASNTNISSFSWQIPAAPGDLLAFGCKLKLTGASATTNAYVRLVANGGAVQHPYLMAFEAWQGRSGGPFTYYNEARVGSGTTGAYLSFTISGPAGATLSIGQVVVKNLTALGVA